MKSNFRLQLIIYDGLGIGKDKVKFFNGNDFSKLSKLAKDYYNFWCIINNHNYDFDIWLCSNY